jgi:hypothetical protein
MYSFNEKIPTDLCEIMGRNKSDKGDISITTSWHNYTTCYYSLFKDIKSNELRIFELGLGTNNTQIASNMGPQGRPGASLYGWAEFFPLASIYGADIDRDILFQTERIRTYYCDQTNSDIIKTMWSNPELEAPFDIIIEDGLHTFSANVCFFENSIHKLKKGGFYIIEDIHTSDFSSFNSKIVEWEIKYPSLKFTLVKIPSSRNTIDNNLLIIKA